MYVSKRNNYSTSTSKIPGPCVFVCLFWVQGPRMIWMFRFPNQEMMLVGTCSPRGAVGEVNLIFKTHGPMQSDFSLLNHPVTPFAFRQSTIASDRNWKSGVGTGKDRYIVKTHEWVRIVLLHSWVILSVWWFSEICQLVFSTPRGSMISTDGAS